MNFTQKRVEACEKVKEICSTAANSSTVRFKDSESKGMFIVEDNYNLSSEQTKSVINNGTACYQNTLPIQSRGILKGRDNISGGTETDLCTSSNNSSINTGSYELKTINERRTCSANTISSLSQEDQTFEFLVDTANNTCTSDDGCTFIYLNFFSKNNNGTTGSNSTNNNKHVRSKRNGRIAKKKIMLHNSTDMSLKEMISCQEQTTNVNFNTNARPSELIEEEEYINKSHGQKKTIRSRITIAELLNPL
ncbi:hypothetical protein ABK040_006182 [Willaertia magna]